MKQLWKLIKWFGAMVIAGIYTGFTAWFIYEWFIRR
jgi:hypothetical protein